MMAVWSGNCVITQAQPLCSFWRGAQPCRGPGARVRTGTRQSKGGEGAAMASCYLKADKLFEQLIADLQHRIGSQSLLQLN